MKFKASQIAQLLNGKVEGNSDAVVSTLSKIEEGKPGSLSFLGNPKYFPYIYSTDASIVIVDRNFVAEHPIKKTCTLIRVEDARIAFAKLLEMYQKAKNNRTGIEQPSFVSKSASVGQDVYVGAFSYLSDNVKIGNNVKLFPNSFIGENSTIGDNTIINAGVKIYHDCIIGKNCIIHAGTVIGSDGFGFTTDNNKVPHIGNVIIEDSVEIGGNCVLDRATLGSTIIRKGAKLDNLVHIAHNTDIGEGTMLAAQVGFAGSSKVGKNVQMGGQVGISGHLEIADNVKIAGQSGVGNNITKEGSIVQGSPSFEIGQYRRSYVLFRNLPDLEKRIKALEKILQELKQSAEK
ncbi:MAG: UDP-3-O-(3-hydroxymyristoyl)glucosamine N-acyltransferase [Bacteroidetes bacterium]|nr:UDP-3-O-(3-hydroxymyristoyl)glucosamine N-acyltransferase [Bacteroidota bacterium]